MAITEDAHSSTSFANISGVRELRDQRLLVADAKGQALYLLDLARDTRRTLGRKGDGPGEYRSPNMVFPLGSDSSVVVDATNRRWYLLDGDRFVTLTDVLRAGQAQMRGDLAGIRTDGAILDVEGVGATKPSPIPIYPGRPENAEAVAVVLRHGAQGAADTVMKGKSYFLGGVRKKLLVGGSPMIYAAVHPLQTFDQAVLFADGRIAVARVNPYQVEWIDPAGGGARGSAVGAPAGRLTGAQRKIIAEDYQRLADGRAVYSDGDFQQWPDVLPAFTSRSLIAGMDGRLYVKRTAVGRNSSPHIDVFSATGGPVSSFSLPPGERLLAVGRKHVYVARTNDDEEELIVRYAPPQRTR